MNRVCLAGRLTRDPDVKAMASGKMVANFTIAVDRRFKNKDGQKETDFIPIVVWGKPAEFVAEYVKKGSLVSLSGRLQVRSYDKDGAKRYISEVVADEVNSIGGKKEVSEQSTDGLNAEYNLRDLDEIF